jgi:uncharacterized membrane protein
MTYIANILTQLRASLWLIPAVISGLAVALAWLLLVFDLPFLHFDEGEIWWLFSGDAGTARELLSALLSGMITMTSLVVSITMVVLSLAAGQLGPRLIGHFIRDWQIQSVLGLFMGTILYTLIVLRSVREDLGADTMPHIAVTAATALSMLCLFALLFYIHKIAHSVIADTVVNQIGDDLERAIADAKSDPDGMNDAKPRFERQAWVSLGVSGYVQAIDYQRLCKLAAKEDLLIELDIRAGHFILREGNHIKLLLNSPPRGGIANAIRKAIVVGAERNPTQDLEYSVRQLVEIAVRALSTGVNDPFTAIAVINRLGAALESASRRPPPPAVYRDENGRLRVRAKPHDFTGLLNASFDQIRQAARGDAAVLIQMGEILGQLALVVDGAAQRAALSLHLDKVERMARKSLDDPADLADFAATADAARKRLAAPGSLETLTPNDD